MKIQANFHISTLKLCEVQLFYQSFVNFPQFFNKTSFSFINRLISNPFPRRASSPTTSLAAKRSSICKEVTHVLEIFADFFTRHYRLNEIFFEFTFLFIVMLPVLKRASYSMCFQYCFVYFSMTRRERKLAIITAPTCKKTLWERKCKPKHKREKEEAFMNENIRIFMLSAFTEMYNNCCCQTRNQEYMRMCHHKGNHVSIQKDSWRFH